MQEGIKMFWICLKRTSAGKTSSPQTFQAVQSTSQSLNLSLKLKHATGEVITYLSAEWSLMWLCTEDRSGDLDTHRLVRFILALRTTYASHKTVIINQIKQKPGYNLPRFYWHIHPTRSTPKGCRYSVRCRNVECCHYWKALNQSTDCFGMYQSVLYWTPLYLSVGIGNKCWGRLLPVCWSAC